MNCVPSGVGGGVGAVSLIGITSTGSVMLTGGAEGVSIGAVRLTGAGGREGSWVSTAAGSPPRSSWAARLLGEGSPKPQPVKMSVLT